MAKMFFKYYDGIDLYNDGAIEEKLLNYYKNNDKTNLDDNESFFYTTDIRKNIVNWYPFKKKSTILEIGAGVGPVTGALLDTGNKVVSVEGSKRRASVIFERYKDYDNLDIYCGNYNEMEFKEKFDYIVLIGVFEYARIFCGGETPFDSFFKNIVKNLKDDGKILIAIENKLGLKYLNGMSEDHFRKPYIGVENYTEDNKFETFTKNELKKMFKKHGFSSKFYGVFPDYKLPSYIFSENHKPELSDFEKFTSYNYYDDSVNFDSKKAIQSFINGEISIEVSNSFFVEISKNDDFANVDFVTYQNYRNSKYFVGTSVGKEIIKFPVSKNSFNHLLELEQTHELLNKNGISACKIYHDDSNRFYNEKISGKTVLSLVNEYVAANKIDEALEEIDNAIKYIMSICKFEKIKEPLISDISEVYKNKCYTLPFSLFDLHLNNIMKVNNNYTLIDMEWVSEKQIPVEYNIFVLLEMVCKHIPKINKYFSQEDFFEKYNIILEKQMLFYKIADSFFNYDKQWLNYDLDKLLKNKNSGFISSNYKTMFEQNLVKEEFSNDLLSYYRDEMKRMNYELNELYSYSKHLENMVISHQNESNRKIYKLFNITQRIIDRLFPFGSIRGRVLGKIIKLLLNIIRFIFKIVRFVVSLLFSLIPFKNLKRKLIHKIHCSRIISKVFRISYYPSLPKRNCILDNNQEIVLDNKTFANGKIAVHIHMYYPDLANEFLNYLKNVPYKFDLYISTSKRKSILPLYLKFKKILNVNKLVVKKSKNSGRDFGPMFVLFGEELKKYDYLLHFHTKKSLRIGSEQADWRKYLLDRLLGSKELVMQYFDLMDNHNVGLAYPSTYFGVPLIAYSWLSNRGYAETYFKKCGFEIEDRYLNFSAGSMFWCKVDAIRQLFDLNLTWEDFGEEVGKDEGTLAHAMERVFGVASQHNGYNFATLGKDGKFYINDDDYGLNNSISYFDFDGKKTYELLKSYNVVTFDIFDTLVTRMVYNPNDVFKIIDEKVSEKFGISKGKYINCRQSSENQVRKDNNYIGDVSIDDIYVELKKELNVSQNIADQIKEIEILTDIDLIIPRYDMLNIYNKLKENGKQLILITDMYYTKDIIEKILHKCGYYGYYDLLVSSELGFRKDNGTMWDYYYKKYNVRSIHVGDNDSSDIHVNIKYDKPNCHVLNGRKAYEISKLFVDSGNSVDFNIIKGLIVNKKLFNSPFSLQPNKGVYIDDFNTLGYCLFGPVMYAFFKWLFDSIKKDTNVLFVSREGYFLQGIYNCIIKNTSKNLHFDNYYFLISRRAISVPTITNRNDIIKILSSYYDGTIKELIYNRLGFMLPTDIENKRVIMSKDIDYVMDVIDEFIPLIISEAKKEKENYLRYIDSLKMNKQKRDCIVDLGYSGTAQYYLTKLLNKNIDGAYFLVTDNLKPLALNDKVFSCFNDTIYDGSFDKHAIGKYSLFLEAFLTSDCGQLIKFDEAANPVYSSNKTKNISKLSEICDGVCEFIEDLSRVSTKDILDLNIDKKMCEDVFEKIVNYSEFSDEIFDVMKIEDLYCTNININLKRK